MTRERHKAVAIPMTYVDGVPYFLVVHDRRYKEWTFVTGGCRRREVYNPLRCAVRELEEETRGTINLKRGTYTYFKFSTNTPEPRDIEDGVDVLNTYHAYIFEVPLNPLEQRNIVKRFKDEKEKMETNQMAFRKNYDENDDCQFDTLEGISSRRNLWPMIRAHVIRNPDFHQALNSPQRTPFFLRT
jgi:8-oxo-dGTP pyrophosphatase MutT (NUDIX family)